MTDRGAKIADAELLRIVQTGDPVAALHRQIVGSAVRLHIPLRDPVQMRDVAKALRVLASTLETESMAKDEAWRILFRSRSAIEMTGRVIRANYGKGSTGNNTAKNNNI